MSVKGLQPNKRTKWSNCTYLDSIYEWTTFYRNMESKATHRQYNSAW